MVASEFLVELEKIRGQFDWTLVEEGASTPERRSKPRLSIRATSKTGPTDVLFDPIGALCYIRTGRIYPLPSWIAAANAIGLSLIDAADLVAAADCRVWRQVHGHSQPDPYLPTLRQRMASALDVPTDGSAQLAFRTRWLRLRSWLHRRSHASAESAESA
jgi:hypothetical protein